MKKAYKIRLYPNKEQQTLIDKTIGCSRFIYNQMLSERINVYQELKDDKEKLYSHKYKTEKKYKQEYNWLSEVSSYALQQSRIDLDTAYKNFFRRVKQGSKQKGFPKFKSKHKNKNSFRICQTSSNIIKLKDDKLILSKQLKLSFRGLSKDFQGIIKSVTVIKNKDNTYEASILVEQPKVIKQRKSNNVVGIDLGLKEFAVCSDGKIINGIKDKLYEIEKEIKHLQKHHSRKQKGSKNKEKVRVKIAKKFKHKTNVQNHFFWHLANKLCSENQAISLENLNVAGMVKNHKLAHSISYSGWSNFVGKLNQKAEEYGTEIYKIDRFFPSSKMCSVCGQLKETLSLGERIYKCDCGLEIDRDINAAINIRNYYLKNKSAEYVDNSHGEAIRPIKLVYNFNGSFDEVITQVNQ